MISGVTLKTHSNMVFSFQLFAKSGLGVIHMEFPTGIANLVCKYVILTSVAIMDDANWITSYTFHSSDQLSYFMVQVVVWKFHVWFVSYFKLILTII